MNAATGELISQHKCSSGAPTAVAFAHDNQRLYVGGGACAFHDQTYHTDLVDVLWKSEGNIKVFSLPDLAEEANITLDWSVYALAVSADGQFLAALGANWDNKVVLSVWNTADLTQRFKTVSHGHPFVPGANGPLRVLAFSADESLLLAVVGDGDEMIAVDTANFQKVSGVSLDGVRTTYIDVVGDRGQAITGGLGSSNVGTLSLSARRIDRIGAPLLNRAGQLMKGDSTKVIAYITTSIERSGYRFFTASVLSLNEESEAGFKCNRRFDMDGSFFPLRSFAVSKNDELMAIGSDFGLIFCWRIKDDRAK